MLNREDWNIIGQMRARGCYIRDIAAEAQVSANPISPALNRGGVPPSGGAAADALVSSIRTRLKWARC